MQTINITSIPSTWSCVFLDALHRAETTSGRVTQRGIYKACGWGCQAREVVLHKGNSSEPSSLETELGNNVDSN